VHHLPCSRRACSPIGPQAGRLRRISQSEDEGRNWNDETADPHAVIDCQSAGNSGQSKYEMGPIEQKIQIVPAHPPRWSCHADPNRRRVLQRSVPPYEQRVENINSGVHGKRLAEFLQCGLKAMRFEVPWINSSPPNPAFAAYDGGHMRSSKFNRPARAGG
jgi:hypothetical protein